MRPGDHCHQKLLIGIRRPDPYVGGLAGRPSHGESANDDYPCGRPDRLAHPPRGGGVRVPDRAVELRAALGHRPVPGAAVIVGRLGARRVLVRDRPAEPAVGRRPAVRRRGGRPLRGEPRAVRRRARVCGRPRADGLFDDAGHAAPLRRRPDRLRPVGLLVQPGHRRARQARPRRVAHASPSVPAPRPDRSASSCSRRSRVR